MMNVLVGGSAGFRTEGHRSFTQKAPNLCILWLDRKPEEARKHLKNALQLDPQNPKAKDALFLLDKGMIKEAARVLQSVN
jgi:Tfp pilus assembly protein PilF